MKYSEESAMIMDVAGMAQAVAHLIGSEEVPGPSPGASSEKPCKYVIPQNPWEIYGKFFEKSLAIELHCSVAFFFISSIS